MANKNKTKNEDKKPQITYDEWLYMNEKEVTVVEINEALKNNKLDIDLWDQLGVISVKLSDNTYLDIEEIESDLGDDEDNKFVEIHNVKSIFTVKMVHESFEYAKEIMTLITKNMGGFFCMDNDNFNPIVK